MNSLRISFLFFLFILCRQSHAQTVPFKSEIEKFRLDDSIHPKPQGLIVFTGSSSIRIWHDLEQDFPGYSILNRGFGGSSLPDVIYHASSVILKYHPKQVLIYCGDNDLAADSTIGGKTVFLRMKRLTKIISKDLGNVSILIVSIKPSPSRIHLIDKVIDANRRIERYCQHHKQMAYINIFDAMLGPDHKPLPDLFLADRLHMNRKGYEIWKKIIGPYLLK